MPEPSNIVSFAERRKPSGPTSGAPTQIRVDVAAEASQFMAFVDKDREAALRLHDAIKQAILAGEMWVTVPEQDVARISELEYEKLDLTLNASD